VPVGAVVVGGGVDESGNVPEIGGGPVPVMVYVPVGAVVAGGGVVLLGKYPFKGGGPVPVIV
jgi:hypothetical protein